MSTIEKLDDAVRIADLAAYGVRFPEVVVRAGEVVVLAGPNGSGKSTLCRLLVGELTATGRVRVLGLDPAADAAELKGRIGYLVKDLETLGALTSRDLLDICAAVRGCGTTYAVELAARLDLDLDRPMGLLSRGQLRRLGIVQALMHRPDLVVLDDPATELDEAGSRVLMALLRETAGRGAAVVITMQSPDGSVADRIVDLQAVAEATTSDVTVRPGVTQPVRATTGAPSHSARRAAPEVTGPEVTGWMFPRPVREVPASGSRRACGPGRPPRRGAAGSPRSPTTSPAPSGRPRSAWHPVAYGSSRSLS